MSWSVLKLQEIFLFRSVNEERGKKRCRLRVNTMVWILLRQRFIEMTKIHDMKCEYDFKEDIQ